ncbi:hypothetical protein MNBD_ALPHA12-885 [hydrothermal vent metagenome]|uniref:Cytochrome b561 bacterial/Ni-hydrogenase domain-containing protein n=1 Tax=hydrothermal vent metagenome TaxID=652676 RepID=A0A3B0TVR2_9ZZZZ
MSSPNPSSAPVLRVWDLPTRLYHWLQFILVISALVIGFFGPEWLLPLHVWIGYAIAALIVFRLVWGLFGPHHSRFASFIPSRKKILDHISALRQGRPQHWIGHNPLGSVMVFALILVLIGILITGIIALGGVENWGPFEGLVDFAIGNDVRYIHYALAYALVALIGFHILGVFVETRLSHTSLIKAMITGNKTLPRGSKIPNLQAAKTAPALIAIFGSGALIGLVFYLGSLAPASGFITPPTFKPYASECSDCHELYNPSLLPRASWKLLMGNLQNHFGEDASLSDKTTKAIADYLNTYASEAWDSEAANQLRAVDPKNPTRITATPFWIKTHSGIDPKLFKTPPVNAKGNCQACHKDAARGRFNDGQISIPKLTPPAKN